MFNRISSIILAVLLFLVLWGSASNLNVVAISLAILTLATLIINYKRLGFSWPHLLLPCLYVLGVGSIFIVLPSRNLRLVFLIAAAISYYILEVNLGKESHYLQNIFLLSSFALYLGLFAIQFYFQINNGWLVLSVFIITYFLSIQGFAGFSLRAKKYFHFLISLICMQVAWGLALWPTYFVVNAIVLFCVFYLLWVFSFSAFFGKLNLKKIYWQFALIGLVLILTLSTAAWKPLSN